ncbi:MAG: VIT domain-containing protein [Victivallaceae bacterium]|nr:VIT domain-containing protein [Victivallaceae bacterium]
MKKHRITITALALIAAFAFAGRALGAGTLTPVGSGQKAAEIISHDVRVVINNGFAKTAVTQRFRNPNQETVEALYSFPIPKSASLSEVTVQMGEQLINGEVVDRKTADKIYGEEKAKGNSAAKAEKNGYEDFTFAIANLVAEAEAVISFVYYQPLPLDTGVCSYVYPLEEGNTRDVAAENFWLRNNQVTGKTNVKITVKSAWPLDGVRSPGQNPTVSKLALKNGVAELEYELGEGLARDFVFHYQLAELPGRLEVIPYRAPGAKEGTFMMALTPGIDLKALDQGADYVFVLDVSGSMNGNKIRSLSDGVAQTIGKLQPHDRFRIVTFASSAREITRSWVVAEPANVQKWSEQIKKLKAGGGTNLHDGITTALRSVDADRVTSIVLVTDAVTNTGEINPQAFHKLFKEKDIRVFGFLMGNSANWPLMELICESSGGFYAGVSNSDDIIGQILQAKSKICYEALHDAEIKISGVKTFDVTGASLKKLYRGQQMVVFGRYSGSGDAVVKFKVKLSGREETYSCRVEFPETDTDNPELERLWAMSMIEQIEYLTGIGKIPSSEKTQLICDLGVRYQLVTDETSMLVLTNEAFQNHGIERRNQARVSNEHAAQSKRASAPIKNYRVDVPTEKPSQTASQPANNRNNMFKHNAPRLGGGAVNWPILGIAILLAGFAVCRTGSGKTSRETE